MEALCFTCFQATGFPSISSSSFLVSSTHPLQNQLGLPVPANTPFTLTCSTKLLPLPSPELLLYRNYCADLSPLPLTLLDSLFCPVLLPLEYLLSTLLSSLYSSPLTPPTSPFSLTWPKLPKSDSEWLVETKVLIAHPNFTLSSYVLFFISAPLSKFRNPRCK